MADFSEEIRVSKWYFGGLASAGAAAVTHPLDLLKVQMQTQKGKTISMLQLTGNVIKQQGIMGLYNGISASLMRQLTYSTGRFALYEIAKAEFAPKDGQMPFSMSALIACASGLFGGFVGSPADLINVRMQNDIRLPVEQRRNYKNAFHGVYKVVVDEGVLRLWKGSSMAVIRAGAMTVGQLSFYDLIKSYIQPILGDNISTHVLSSLSAGGIATTLTQPVDVLKTRMMNAKPGEFQGIVHLVTATAKEGPLAFFKGYIPAFTRLAPHTVLTFVFLEQLRMNYGTIKL